MFQQVRSLSSVAY